MGKKEQQHIRALMATHAREILDETGTTGLIKGGESEVNEVISALINAYPQAKEKNADNPDYSFTDLVVQVCDTVSGGIIQTGYRQTRGNIANRYGFTGG